MYTLATDRGDEEVAKIYPTPVCFKTNPHDCKVSRQNKIP